jgi:hemolysin III
MSQVLQPYTAGEKLADGCVHVLSVSASITGAVILVGLISGMLPALSTASVVVYAVTLVALFAASASYHMAPWPGTKDILRRLDHSAIYLKIAGTYTPLTLISMAAVPGGTLLAVVWAVGLLGIVFKLFLPGHLERTSYALYLVAGWAGLLMLDELLATFSLAVLVLLGVGGALYTIGVAFHLWKSLPYHNAVWHGFVLAASACHYSAILCAVVPELKS